jgi:hypothetical protein
MAIKINFNSLISLSWGTLAGTVYLFTNATTANALTFVLDFNDANQENTSDIFGTEVTDFNVNSYGFAPTEFDLVTNSILDKVESHFYDIPTESNYFGATTSPIPDGQELDIDFEIGEINAFTPSDGDSDYYFVQIGSAVSNEVTSLGQAGLNTARSSNGTVNSFFQRRVVGSVFTDNIVNLRGLTPSNTLKTGNLEATTNAIAGTLSHEIGHTLSLNHVYKGQSETFGNVPPLLGTGALDLPNSDRINDRAFSFSAKTEGSRDEPQNNGIVRVVDGEPHIDVARDPFAPLPNIPANAPTVNHVQQLVNAIGLRDSVSVPWEFSPSVVAIVGGMGLISSRKKSRLSKKD